MKESGKEVSCGFNMECLSHLILSLDVIQGSHVTVPQTGGSLCILEEDVEVSLLGPQYKVQGSLGGRTDKGHITWPSRFSS